MANSIRLQQGRQISPNIRVIWRGYLAQLMSPILSLSKSLTKIVDVHDEIVIKVCYHISKSMPTVIILKQCISKQNK